MTWLSQPREQPIQRPAVDDAVGRNARKPCVGHGGLRVGQLSRRVRVAVERKKTTRVEGATIMERLRANSKLFAQADHTDGTELRSFMKRQWEILFLLQNKAQEAGNFGLQTYTWSVRNAVWLLQSLYSAKRRELGLLFESPGKPKEQVKREIQAQIEPLYEQLTHMMSLEFASIRPEMSQRLEDDVDWRQRKVVIDSVEAFLDVCGSFLEEREPEHQLTLGIIGDAEARDGFPEDGALVADLLKLLLKIRAKESGVASKLIARSDELEMLASGVRDGLNILGGWRFDEFGRDALDLVEGRLAFATEHGRLKLTRTVDQVTRPGSQRAGPVGELARTSVELTKAVAQPRRAVGERRPRRRVAGDDDPNGPRQCRQRGLGAGRRGGGGDGRGGCGGDGRRRHREPSDSAVELDCPRVISRAVVQRGAHDHRVVRECCAG